MGVIHSVYIYMYILGKSLLPLTTLNVIMVHVPPDPGGGGHSFIWAIQGGATGQGMVFWPCCPKQGMQFDLPLS